MAAAELELVVTLKDQASKDLKGLGGKLGDIGNVAAGVAAGLAAAGTAAAAFAVVSISEYSKVGDEVEKMAERTGLATEEVSALRVAADASGTSIETVEGAIKKMSLNMAEAADGTSAMSELLDGFGISIDEFKARTPAQQFEDLANSIGSIEDPTERTQKAVEAFGKSGADLIPLFEDGKFSMEEWSAKAKELGVSFDELSAQQAAQLNDVLGEMNLAFTGLKLALAKELAPAIIEIVGKVTEAIVAFRQWAFTVQEAGGLINYAVNAVRGYIERLMTTIEANTGLITVLRTAWQNVVMVIRENLLPALGGLWEVLKPLEPFLKVLIEIIGVLLIGAFIAIVKIIEVSLLAAIQGLTWSIEAMTIGVKIVSAAWNGFIDILASAVTWIDKVIAKLKSLDIVKGAVSGVQNLLGFTPQARASGGPVSGGRPYLVGEQGPELFVPGASGTIVPNGSLGGGGATIVINVTGNTFASDMDIDAAARRMGDALMSRMKLHRKIGA